MGIGAGSEESRRWTVRISDDYLNKEGQTERLAWTSHTAAINRDDDHQRSREQANCEGIMLPRVVITAIGFRPFFHCSGFPLEATSPPPPTDCLYSTWIGPIVNQLDSRISKDMIRIWVTMFINITSSSSPSDWFWCSLPPMLLSTSSWTAGCFWYHGFSPFLNKYSAGRLELIIQWSWWRWWQF